jgi:signal peptidase I
MSELTIDTAYKELQQILNEKVLLVVGTGASMAVDIRFGMNALSDELFKKIPCQIESNDKSKIQWQKVADKLQNGIDLESALKEVNDKFLIKKVVRVTGDFVAELDKVYKLEILDNKIEVPIGTFIRKLFKGLREYAPVLDIITPNYDLLIEHCCDQYKIPYITGFYGGIKKHENWEEASNQMLYIKPVPNGKKINKKLRTKKHIQLHKVHGSLNWFYNGSDKFEDNSLTYSSSGKNSSIERFIITPGDSKYQKAFLNAFDSFANANEAVKGEGAFVFVGYGFNDDHIQNKIVSEILDEEKPGMIITKGLSGNAEKLLARSENLWAVYHISKKYGKVIEDDSLIYNKEFDKPLTIKNKSLWRIEEFSREILGE